MGVEKQIIRPGTGPNPSRGQSVTVHCTGYGNLSLISPFQFSLQTLDPPFVWLIHALIIRDDGESTGKNGDLSQKFWSTKDPGQQPFTFKIGQGSVIKGIILKC